MKDTESLGRIYTVNLGGSIGYITRGTIVYGGFDGVEISD